MPLTQFEPKISIHEDGLKQEYIVTFKWKRTAKHGDRQYIFYSFNAYQKFLEFLKTSDIQKRLSCLADSLNQNVKAETGRSYVFLLILLLEFPFNRIFSDKELKKG